jgi:hypothetical protein
MGRKKVVAPEPFRFKRWSNSKSDQSSFPDAIAAGQQQFTVLDLTKPKGHRIVSPASRARVCVQARTKKETV